MCEILIVDDDEITLATIKNALQPYAVASFTNAEDAVSFSRTLTIPPHLVILDLRLPDKDGFALCAALREHFSPLTTDVIFYTASTSLHERIQGFDVGASDFLIKPVVTSELQQKVHRIILHRRTQKQQSQQKQQQGTMLRSVMSELNENHTLLHFMRAINHATCVSDVTQLIVDTATSLGLRTSLRLHYTLKGKSQFDIVTNCGDLSPLETSLLCSMANSEPVTVHNQRLFLNASCLSQIVRNLPEDKTTANRFYEMLTSVIDSAGVRINCLLRTEELASVIMDVETLNRDAAVTQQAQSTALEDELNRLASRAQSGDIDIAQFTQHCLHAAQSAMTCFSTSLALSALTAHLSDRRRA